ncbi:MAG: hypothetical protein R3F31_03090 [Verrucomicrobiales bacterium]
MRKAATLGYIHPRDAAACFGSSRTTATGGAFAKRGGWIIRNGQKRLPVTISGNKRPIRP